VNLFENYDWPGNVRELKNIVQRAVLVCADSVLYPRHLPPRLLPERAVRPTVSVKVGTPLIDVEREMIVQTLSFTRNNRKRAADVLGISRRSLYNKLRRHGIV
jgi:DNA-binding NtrC family response regulator